MKIHDVKQRTDEWHLLRKGKVTGTGLKRIVGSDKTRETYLYELVAERLSVGVPTDESDMHRGSRLEEEARQKYAEFVGKEVVEYGFLESEENPLIGYSPDGYVKSKKMDRGCEIKCLSGGNHVRAYITKEIPKDYYAQGIQAFIVNPKLTQLDFVFYDPRIPQIPFFVIPMVRKDVLKDIAQYRVAEEKFLEDVDVIIWKIIGEL